MKTIDDAGSISVIPTPDSTVGALSGIDSRYMTLHNTGELIAKRPEVVASNCESKGITKAVLYARVSSDTQQKEATIESQLFELRRQIATAGHALVKEYVDDGITGTLLDRPALEQLRQDAKIELYDRIYFHAADCIARQSSHQDIIVDELLKRGKQITIGGIGAGQAAISHQGRNRQIGGAKGTVRQTSRATARAGPRRAVQRLHGRRDARKRAMRSVVAYCRTAWEPQRGPSAARGQARAVRRYAARRGLTLGSIYMDAGVSGITLKRPGLRRLLADCRAGRVGTVVMRDPARLSRDTSQLCELLCAFLKAGVRVEYSTRQGQCDKFLKILSAVARLEEARVGGRLSTARPSLNASK